MITRRDLLAASASLAALPAGAERLPTQAELLRFDPLGQVTLLHLPDLHAQLLPVFFREPETNLGVGEARGQLPHITGTAFLAALDVTEGSAMAHALAHADFSSLARRFGPMGGVDRLATILKAILARDYQLVQAGVLVLAASVVLLNTILDLVYGMIDPRLRQG